MSRKTAFVCALWVILLCSLTLTGTAVEGPGAITVTDRTLALHDFAEGPLSGGFVLLAGEDLMEPVTVTSRLRYEAQGAVSDNPSLWLAGLSFDADLAPLDLAVTWEETGSWIPLWRLRLRATPGLLHPSLAPERDASLHRPSEYINLSSTTPPEPGHVYEAELTYLPDRGALIVRVHDATAQKSLIDATFPVNMQSGPVFAGAGAASRAGTGRSWSLVVERVEVVLGQEVEPPPPWLVQTSLSWLVVEPVPDGYRRASSASFNRGKALAVQIIWPSAELAGRLRVDWKTEERSGTLGELQWSAQPTWMPIDTGEFPSGDLDLLVRYVENDHEYLIGEANLIVLPSRLNILLPAPQAHEGTWRGIAVLASPDIRIDGGKLGLRAAGGGVTEISLPEIAVGTVLEMPFQLEMDAGDDVTDQVQAELLGHPDVDARVYVGRLYDLYRQGEIDPNRLFPVRDYGAVPGAGEDAGLAVRDAIAAAVRSGSGAAVIFEPGVYFVQRPQSDRHFFEIRGAQGLTLLGDETHLVFGEPTAGAFLLDSVVQSRVEGISIDYDPVPYTQGRVVLVDRAEGSFDLAVDPGYPSLEHSMFYTPIWGMLRDSATGYMKPGVHDHYYIESINSVRAGVYRLQLRDQSAAREFEVGDRFVLGIRKTAAFYLVRTSDVVIENVTVYTAPGSAFTSLQSEGVQLRSSRVILKPGTDRMLTTTADGFHHQQGRLGPVLEGNLFEGMADDAVNIYTVPNRLLEVRSDREVVVSGHGRIQPGDLVDVFDPWTGCVRAAVEVIDVQRIGGEYHVTFDQPVNGMVAGADHRSAYHLYNRNEMGPGFVIRNNTFRNHRRHGVYLKSENGLVEGNLFQNLSGFGVVVKNEPDWPEGSFSQNIVIRDNVFDSLGLSIYGIQPSAAAISIQAQKLGYGVADCPGQRGIVIERNDIRDWPRYAIYIGGADGVLVRENRIGPGRTDPALGGRSTPIFVEKSRNVDIAQP